MWRRSMVLRRKFSWRYIIMLFFVLMAAGAAFLGQQPKPLQATMVADSENGTKVLVLNYHKIDHTFISLSVRPEDFDSQMKYLRDNGYHSISPDELYEALAGSGQLPENPVLITFDDGYEDNYTNAYPILKKYGFKATIFVVTGFLDKHKKGYLSWDEAREMDKNGITIESHTVNHRSMTDLTDDELRAELVDSKKKAETELGHEVNYIAYPTGTYNLHIAQMVKEAGYKAAFTIKYGNVDKASNIYALERVPIFHTEETNKDFIERIRYQPIFESFGWMKN
ncbi:polysaccharide deacetylase family protein [Selenomonas ruminantium]|uniref:polysaccharide deacetylase family protein n=1 Tax=Selenomonas ruminantium TaxID=971 RepID=UPI0026E9E891|nr:polysaccharide deacetylase family protein [Selenomonas ruminantium]